MHPIFVSGATQEFGQGEKSEGKAGNASPQAQDDAPGNFRLVLDEALESRLTSAYIQEKFTGSGVSTLLKLDGYIKDSAAVVHLVGRVTGSMAKPPALEDLLARYPKLAEEMPAVADALNGKVELSYTQWEAYLAIYHKKPLFVCELTRELPLSPNLDPALVRPDLQQEHLGRLRKLGHYAELPFGDATSLAIELWKSLAGFLFGEPSTSAKVVPPASILRAENPQPLFGREKEVDAGLRYLEESRLVTVHAPPGVGKTRVVERIMHRIHESDHHVPVYFFDVNYKSQAGEVAEQIRAELGFGKFDETKEVQSQLGIMLSQLGPVLLVLDNFEQVGSHKHQTNAPRVAAQTVNEWLRWAKELRILVGSRRRLELAKWQERCIHLEALSAPSIAEADKLPPTRLRAYDSVRLFISQAAEHERNYEKCSESQLHSIAHIVAMTGGFPCAVEIAAARLEDIELEDIQSRMSATFTFPEGGDEHKARHYLHTQLDQVLEDLSDLERRCILQASQFRHGFSFSAAAAVFNPDPVAGELKHDIVEAVLKKLCLAELLKRETVSIDGRDERRYGFYLPIEEWAEDKWADDRFVSQAERDLHYHRYVDYFCGYFEPLNAQAYTENSSAALERIKLDRPNFTECHDQACERRDVQGVLRIMRTLFPSLHHQGPTTLLETYLQRTLEFADEFPAADHVALLDQQVMCFSSLGRWEEMFAFAKQALMLAETTTDPKLKLRCQVRMHSAHKHLHGERDTGELDDRLSGQLLAAGDLENYCIANKESASSRDWSGKPDEGLQIIETALRTAGLRNPSGRGFLLNMGGLICWHDGRLREAVRYLRSARPIFRHHGPQNWPAGVLTNLGLVYIDLEKFAAASYLLNRAAEQHNSSAWMAVNDVAIARLHLRSHEYQQAINWCKRVTASVEATQYHENKALLTSIHAAALFKVGRLEEADQKLRLALERMRPNSIKMRRFFGALIISADCAVALGNPGYAKECLAEAGPVANLRRIDAACAVPAYRRLFERMQELQSQLNQTAS